MVTMRIIDKDNRMVTTFETTQTNVEGSSVIRAPKKQKKEVTIEEKRKNQLKTSSRNIPRALTRLNVSMSMNQLGVNSQIASPLETSMLKG